jgi:hypothetical protein
MQHAATYIELIHIRKGIRAGGQIASNTEELLLETALYSSGYLTVCSFALVYHKSILHAACVVS